MTTAERPHALYRFFDHAGVLLYVGRTVDPGSRWKQHSKEKLWWLDVVSVRVEHFPTLNAVAKAERRAIETEHPRYNIVHSRPRIGLGSIGEAPGTAEDEVVALGLRDGRCPVGMIKVWTDHRVELSLYSFMSDTFGYQRASYSTADVDEVRYARVLTPHEMRKQGYRAPEDPTEFAKVLAQDGGPVWDMNPLAQFQTQWKHRHGLASDEDLARSNRLFAGV